MMTTRGARRTTRSAALAAVTVALALGLTACGGSGKDASGKNAKAAADSRTATTATSRSTSGGARPAAAASGAHRLTTKGTVAAVRQCRGDELLVTAVHRFAGQQGDHLLLTASNEGEAACWVTSYPAVKLGGDVDGATLPHSGKDVPGGGKHITLRPGGKAYSAVNLFDYGSKNHTAQSFAIALRGADGRTGPFYSVDAKGRQPRFSWNEADVLNWNTRKPYDF
ncbi:uncharacterized protein DUF4232 [Streptomyces sp. BK022]|uniref:DUF4232 domain-containing protein n=1 Tax=Streptomyces sp. BK022 TaxID=2512123 RepID=UPI0010D453B8|nr:DUF4232 domain-containing protein [Streptomyces sp. BK022]RZU45683.1 uncharacterized protein DUF4232 [Streptomyces sp. BK022]